MSIRYLITISSLLSVFASHPLYGQNSLDSLVTDFALRSQHHPSETIYLQTSKDVYETGEDLWFKTYHLGSGDFNLTADSHTLYLQVFSPADSIVWQEKYPVTNGISQGHIYIDKNMPAGDYTLEVYTAHRYYGGNSTFSSFRKIRIVENISAEPVSVADTALITKKNIRFETYPEGGNLVGGLPSRLAFKATDGKGNPVDVSGMLYQNDSLIADFASIHDGMGAIRFTPSADKDYHIRLSTGQQYALPQIYSQGISLSLTGQDKDFIGFTIRQSPALPPRTVYLIGQTRGIPYCGATIRLRDSIRIRVPLKEFTGQGIAEFTLLEQNGTPLAERLVYVHPQRSLYITATTDNTAYLPKNKVSMKIKVTDENRNPVRANLGISVFDKAYSEQSYPVNILTHCFLNSQIRGNVHNPYYYFDEANANRQQALDLLLMTQGWRRYVWQYGDDSPAGEKLLTDGITGIQTIKNKKMQGSPQLIELSGASGEALFVETDSTGYFSVLPAEMNHLRGGYLYFRPLLSKEYGPKLAIDDPFTAINDIRRQKSYYHPFTDPQRVKADTIDREPLINQFGDVMLDEVMITAEAKRYVRDKFMGRLDSLAQRDFGPYVCEHGHLENYMEGFTVHHDPRYCPCPYPPKERNTPVIGKRYHLIKPKYDAVNCHYFTVEREISVIYEGPLYSEEELLEMSGYKRAKGYYGKREFYMPDDMEMLSSLPDVRNTLYWNPEVITDEKGEASIDFYSSDIISGFTGRIEGIGGDGLLGVGGCGFRVTRGGQAN